MRKNADGSIDILIQHEPPTATRNRAGFRLQAAN
ncbi:hypothetical protein [Bradyrhizobium sp. sBnM-33]